MTSSNPSQKYLSSEGLIFGFIGVLCFSFTLPATRLAVAGLDPVIVGLGRALVAACLAAPLLIVTRQKLPEKHQWLSILIVMIGVIVGFPMLTALAMRLVPASHGAVVLGLLPFATAIAGAIRTHERPSTLFWLASASGSIAVVAYALSMGGGSFHLADFALLGAVILAALGYAEGARLARDLGGWQVICWALLLSVPFLIGPVCFEIWQHGLFANASAWFGFAYVSIISMFLAFFAWYRGLAIGGVARVSQLQLLQPFLTLGFATLFLGESFSLGALLSVSVVVISIFVSKRSQVTHVRPGRPILHHAHEEMED
jgi:drug/metabolite transporter (DMT)-like permease